MKNCKLCLEHDKFLSERGLCNSCEFQVASDIQIKTKILNDCLVLVKTTKNFETALRRYKVAIEHLETFSNYEILGLLQSTTGFSSILNDVDAQTDYLLIPAILRHYENATRLVETLSQMKSARNKMYKLNELVKEAGDIGKDKHKYKEISDEIQNKAKLLEYRIFSKQAQEYRLRGDKKKERNKLLEAKAFLCFELSSFAKYEEELNLIGARLKELD